MAWDEGGHKYTSFYVCILAGIDAKRAHVIAFYSQWPDMHESLDAIGNTWDFLSAERRMLKRVLHSLHGGDAQQVRERRKILEAMILDRIKDPEKDWETGLLIHAYGDAFAHTLAGGEAYGECKGHLFDGHQPDRIAEHADIYQLYAIKLFECLAQGKSEQRSRLSEAVERVVEGELASGGGNKVVAAEAVRMGFSESVFMERLPIASTEEARMFVRAMEDAFSKDSLPSSK